MSMKEHVQQIAVAYEAIYFDLANKIDALRASHSKEFANSVAGNVGIEILVNVLANTPEGKERDTAAASIAAALSANLQLEIVARKADSVIARASGKGAA